MNQSLFLGLLGGILLAVLVVRLRKSAKRPKRWMPDIRRVV